MPHTLNMVGHCITCGVKPPTKAKKYQVCAVKESKMLSSSIRPPYYLRVWNGQP